MDARIKSRAEQKKDFHLSLTIGTQLGAYEITSLLGKGGMGEV